MPLTMVEAKTRRRRSCAKPSRTLELPHDCVENARFEDCRRGSTRRWPARHGPGCASRMHALAAAAASLLGFEGRLLLVRVGCRSRPRFRRSSTVVETVPLL